MDQGPVIVFVCEHGAAKSIVAAAYFNKIACQTGLGVHAIARGTSPEPALSENAVMGLLADDLRPTEPRPQKLESADVASSRKVVAFCILPQEYEQEQRIEHWDDVPPVSADYEQARDAILVHIQQLVTRL